MEESRLRHALPPPSRSGMMTPARPITQQGLSGVRPIQTSGGGLNRMYKDKRYYMSLMQTHMNTIREELTNLRKATADYRSTSLNRLEARKTAEVLAKNYAEFQEMLSIYNIVLEIQHSQDKANKLAFDTTTLKEKNKQLLNELDILVTNKIQRENKIAALKNEFLKEDKAAQNLINGLSPEDKLKYVDAINENQKSIQKITELQQEINLCKDGLKKFEKDLSQNQLKQEHFNIAQNLNKAKSQKESLLAQLQETLTPTQQREVLVQQVKNDKLDTESLLNIKDSLEQDLKAKQERLDELEAELNDKNATRLKKHKELRDRDEQMRKFMEVFAEKSPIIREKIDTMQNQILIILDYLTSSVVDINFEELDNIQSNLNQSSLDGLSNQYSLYSSRLSRLKAFKEKYKNELESLKEKTTNLQVEMQTYKNPQKARDEMRAKSEILKERQESLRHSLASTMAAVTEVERRQTEIEANNKAELFNNEFYHEIHELELRIEAVEKQNQDMQSVLNSVLLSEEVKKKLEEIEELVSKRNEKLIYRLRNKKSKINETEDTGSINEFMWQEDHKLTSPGLSNSYKEGTHASYSKNNLGPKTEILEF